MRVDLAARIRGGRTPIQDGNASDRAFDAPQIARKVKILRLF
jgi:hypothetical protein